MAERTIALKYAARCRRCGRDLPAGTTARWNPDTKWVACARCPAPPRAPSATRAGSPRGAAQSLSRTAPPEPASPWRTLVRYHLAATRRAGVALPPAVSDHDRWTLLPLEREDLVTGRGDTITVDRRLGRLAASTESGEAVYYGWPTVVATDSSGRLRVAPLLMTELELPGVGQRTAVPRDDQPYVNPGLLTGSFFPLDALAIARADGRRRPSVRRPCRDAAARVDAFCEALGSGGQSP